MKSNFPEEEAIFLRFAEGELVCYNKSSDWRADWGPPGPDLCQSSATFCFHEDVCSCRTCSRELDADECFSISESFNLGCPTHNMHMRGEILLMRLEALLQPQQVPVGEAPVEADRQRPPLQSVKVHVRRCCGCIFVGNPDVRTLLQICSFRQAVKRMSIFEACFFGGHPRST